MSGALPLHGEILEPACRPYLGVAAKGFRPFFFLAAAFAVAIVPIWLLAVGGAVRLPPYLDPMIWHAHEMIFGFLVAVIAGFLLTAVGNWTQRETVVGVPLLALSMVWITGRVVMAFAERLPRAVPALVDLVFIPLLMITLARPIIATRNHRNFLMVAVLGALYVANVAVHLDALHIITAGFARRACLVSIDVVLLIILIIAGRVFPMFTKNATGVQSIRSIPSLDVLTVAGMGVLTALDVFVPDTRVAATASGIVGVLAAVRAVHWGTRGALRQPLLWILHAGYAWLTLGLLLRAVAGFNGLVPSSLATHALTVGAAGSITLGMMARVALGHTGRPLVASAVTWAFGAVNAAAFARVVVPLFAPPTWYFGALLAAGALWSTAFLIYLVVYTPILMAPRSDGKPG